MVDVHQQLDQPVNELGNFSPKSTNKVNQDRE
jgi:hypothetical protein